MRPRKRLFIQDGRNVRLVLRHQQQTTQHQMPPSAPTIAPVQEIVPTTPPSFWPHFNFRGSQPQLLLDNLDQAQVAHDFLLYQQTGCISPHWLTTTDLEFRTPEQQVEQNRKRLRQLALLPNDLASAISRHPNPEYRSNLHITQQPDIEFTAEGKILLPPLLNAETQLEPPTTTSQKPLTSTITELPKTDIISINKRSRNKPSRETFRDKDASDKEPETKEEAEILPRFGATAGFGGFLTIQDRLADLELERKMRKKTLLVQTILGKRVEGLMWPNKDLSLDVATPMPTTRKFPQATDYKALALRLDSSGASRPLWVEFNIYVQLLTRSVDSLSTGSQHVNGGERIRREVVAERVNYFHPVLELVFKEQLAKTRAAKQLLVKPISTMMPSIPGVSRTECKAWASVGLFPKVDLTAATPIPYVTSSELLDTWYPLTKATTSQLSAVGQTTEVAKIGGYTIHQR